MTDLYVVFGGQSAEHEVSIKSACNILAGADRERFNVYGLYIAKNGLWSIIPAAENISVEELQQKAAETPGHNKTEILHRYLNNPANTLFFPIIHGINGEDGTLQGLFEYLGAPYVGCGVLASSVGMEKTAMKLVAKALGIPMAPYMAVENRQYALEQEKCLADIEATIGYPCFVKPSKGGSSIGISSARSREALVDALALAFQYDNKAIVETLIVGREIEIGVLGNKDPQCSLPGEFVRNPSFFDYHAKYLDADLKMNVPAEVPAQDVALMQHYATAFYNEIGGAGMSRMDFFYTSEGEVLFNEINTAPGFTAMSMYPTLWQKTAGMDTKALVNNLADLALALFEEKNRIKEAVFHD